MRRFAVLHFAAVAVASLLCAAVDRADPPADPAARVARHRSRRRADAGGAVESRGKARGVRGEKRRADRGAGRADDSARGDRAVLDPRGRGLETRAREAGRRRAAPRRDAGPRAAHRGRPRARRRAHGPGRQSHHRRDHHAAFSRGRLRGRHRGRRRTHDRRRRRRTVARAGAALGRSAGTRRHAADPVLHRVRRLDDPARDLRPRPRIDRDGRRRGRHRLVRHAGARALGRRRPRRARAVARARLRQRRALVEPARPRRLDDRRMGRGRGPIGRGRRIRREAAAASGAAAPRGAGKRCRSPAH